MEELANLWLEQYEIKKPDYDYVEREESHFDSVHYRSPRFIRKAEGFWKKRDKSSRFSPSYAKLMFTGDINCFSRQFYNSQTENGYKFNYEFEKIKSIFAQADLVVGNLETSIFPSAQYKIEKPVEEQSSYHNAPYGFLKAVRKAGFDVVTTANNHDLDTGAVGLGETVSNIKRFGLIQTGTFNDIENKRYEIIRVKGIKVAIVAFATDHNGNRENLTPEGAEFLLNDYSKEKAGAIIEDARNDGADIVIVCIHWGVNKETKPNEEQEKIATELAELGYDCIIGSHPHVLQPFSYVEAGDKKVPVFYSMGNFVSHNSNNKKSRSVIACIDIEKTEDSFKLSCSYIPIFTCLSYKKKKYVVLPLKAECQDPRNDEKLKKIVGAIGNEINIATDVGYSEYYEDID